MLKSSVFTACIVGAALFSLTSAVAQEDVAAQEVENAPEAPRCVRLINVDGYEVMDRRHVLLKGSVNRRYLATLRSSCPDLHFGLRLATSFGPNARICNPSFEFITTPDGYRCRIDRIEEVESLEAARLLIEARTADEEASTGSR